MQSNPLSVSQFLFEILKLFIATILGIVGTLITLRYTKKVNKEKDTTDIHTSIAQQGKYEAETIKLKVESGKSAYEIVLDSITKVDEIGTKLNDANDKIRELEDEIKGYKSKDNLIAEMIKNSVDKIDGD